MAQPLRIAGFTAATAAVLFGSYALYFDYQRRHNPEFRKQIRQQQKKAQLQDEAEKKAMQAKIDKELREAIARVQREPTPQTPEQQEAFFQECVAEGEKLAVMGPEFHVQAAMHFFRALRVYPNPVELLMIYQKVVPPQVFALVVQAMQAAPGAAGPAGGAGAGGLPLGVGTGLPAAAPATVDDIDDASPVGGAGAGAGAAAAPSVGSGAEWENIAQE